MTICRVGLRLEFYRLHRYRRHGLGPMRNGELEVRPPPTQGNHKEAFCLSRALDGGGQSGRGRVSCEKSKPQTCTMWNPNLYYSQVWFSQAKKFNIKIVQLLGLWQKQMQKHCAGPFPELRAHSTPAGKGRKPDKLAVLGARGRRDTQVNRQFLCGQLSQRSTQNAMGPQRGAKKLRKSPRKCKSLFS